MTNGAARIRRVMAMHILRFPAVIFGSPLQCRCPWIFGANVAQTIDFCCEILDFLTSNLTWGPPTPNEEKCSKTLELVRRCDCCVCIPWWTMASRWIHQTWEPSNSGVFLVITPFYIGPAKEDSSGFCMFLWFLSSNMSSNVQLFWGGCDKITRHCLQLGWKAMQTVRN